MRTVRWPALVATAWLAFNMVAISAWWGGVNATGGALWWVQMGVLVGFVYLVLFDLGSAVWILARSCWRRGAEQEACESGWLLVLALLAIISLVGAKAMVDEIAREHAQGWGVQGEWVILYALLTVQLAYGLALLVRREGGREPPRTASPLAPTAP